ncbi:MGH1-like glycoside hydrolase domain-containing protein [Dongia deserti]|uniref:MGH1-like glycoside hydrolase domain-containing protein n=1 Tax=Dongia deserti TaxID=2268030 RepID=UPI000E64CA50|nr:trehalase family glycosidase [Dongia deserti]
MTDILTKLQQSGRGWNSWVSEWPAQASHLPRGLTLAPVAYAASKNAFTDFPAQSGGVRYGPRSVRGEQMALRLSQTGTTFDLHYDRPEQDTLRAAWSTVKLGEWGLRFWLCWCLRWQPDPNEPPIDWTYDETTGDLLASHPRHGTVALVAQAPALMATFHADMAALRAEFEQQGYFHLASRGTRGSFPCLRYNFEETPRLSVAIAFGTTQKEASDRARRALATETVTLPKLQTGRGGHALDAVRDVVGWNSVWDAINTRPYTSLSRAWVAQKFGGFGLWLDDIFYHAWMAALFDRDIAVENLEALLSNAQPAGNLPCLMTGRDSWVDRSQPPIGSLATWMIAAHSGDSFIVDLAYSKLLANHDWWFSHRDGNGDGLMGWGTSPGVGDGLYRGTKLGARNESSMDNSPIHDETDLDRASGNLTAADVGLNSLLVLDAEILSRWAEERGDTAAAQRLRQRGEALAVRVRDRLWDDERKVFANRLWDGRFVRSIAPTSFYPLLAGVATPEQTQHLLNWLDNPRKFGGFWRLPSVTRDDPAYRDNVYWRGRIWPPLNLLTYLGLRRAGQDEAAGRLAADSYRLFEQAWRKGQCPENFNAESGLADDQPDTDLFYGWGGLMPLIATLEVSRLTPWAGWEIDLKTGKWSLGPLRVAGHEIVVKAADGWVLLLRDDVEIAATDMRGTWSRLAIAEDALSCRTTGGGRVRIPRASIDRLLEARYDGQLLQCEVASAGRFIECAVPAKQGGGDLVLRWRN